jgi:YfiH family protein
LGTVSSDLGRAWDDVAQAAGVETRKLIRVRQVHGSAVVRVRSEAPRQATAEADIIMTDDPSVALAIQTADCVPILLADPRTGAVAAAHAGWRGLALRVPQRAVEALQREFGSKPSDLIAAAGPSISADRYEVGPDVRQRFIDAGFEPRQLDQWFLNGRRPEHWQFDGWQATRDQLMDAGLETVRVHVAGLCTAADTEHFCSYRRDGSPVGRMAAVIRPRPALR